MASADYAAALEIDPRNVDALVNRAAIHATRGEYAPAVAALNTAIELRPDNTLAWYNRGYVRFAQKQYEAAIADYSNALARDPMLVAAYVNRCLARVLAGQDPRLAVVDCDVALRAMPNNLDARETRGFIHLKLGDTETALAEYGALAQARSQPSARSLWTRPGEDQEGRQGRRRGRSRRRPRAPCRHRRRILPLWIELGMRIVTPEELDALVALDGSLRQRRPSPEIERFSATSG